MDNLKMISLADTVRMATPQQVVTWSARVITKYDYLEIGTNCTATLSRLRKRFCRRMTRAACRFDSALGGLGGGGSARCVGWQHPDGESDGDHSQSVVRNCHN